MMKMKRTLFLCLFSGILILSPLSVWADHNQAHTDSQIRFLKAQIEALVAHIMELSKQEGLGDVPISGGGFGPTDGSTVIVPTPQFNRDLYFGLRNDSDVTDLQEFLTDQDYYKGPVTGNYFILTLRAVRKFQLANELEPTGRFDAATRSMANKILSKIMDDHQSVVEIPPTTPPIPPGGQSVQIIVPSGKQDLVLSQPYTIYWSKPAGVIGSIYLNGQDVSLNGYITRALGPNDTSFFWDVASVRGTQGEPLPVVPGRYTITLKFNGQSPDIRSNIFSIVPADSPSYSVPQWGSILGRTYTFTAKVVGAVPNTPVYFFLQRPDGSMKYDDKNDVLASLPLAQRSTDASGSFSLTTTQTLIKEAQTGTYVSWVKVGGIGSNRFYHSVTTPVRGAIKVTVSPIPVAQNVVVGTQGFTFANYLFDATASSDHIRITSFRARFTGTNNTADQLQNCQLWHSGIPLTTGSNIVNPTNSISSGEDLIFKLDSGVIIAGRGQVETISLKCDVKDNIDMEATAGVTTFSFGITNSPDSISSSGFSSGQPVTAIISQSNGQPMTLIQSNIGKQPVVTVTSPNGGEIWSINKNYEIKWDATDIPSNYSFQLALVDSKFTPKSVTGFLDVYTRRFLFPVPDNISPGSYYVEVQALIPSTRQVLVTDRSDTAFTIAAQATTGTIYVSAFDKSSCPPDPSVPVSWCMVAFDASLYSKDGQLISSRSASFGKLAFWNVLFGDYILKINASSYKPVEKAIGLNSTSYDLLIDLEKLSPTIDPNPFHLSFDSQLSDVDNRQPAVSVNQASGIRYGNGLKGQAVKFVDPRSYAQYSCSGVFNKDAGTVEALVKFDKFTSSDAVIWHTDDSRYVLYYDYASDNTEKRITARAGGESFAAQFRFDQNYGSTRNTLTANQWHHLAMTWIGAPQGIVELYVDGELKGTAQYQEGQACSTFRVGNNYWPGLNWGGGWIDELKIYPRELSVDEIKSNYASYNLPR